MTERRYTVDVLLWVVLAGVRLYAYGGWFAPETWGESDNKCSVTFVVNVKFHEPAVSPRTGVFIRRCNCWRGSKMSCEAY